MQLTIEQHQLVEAAQGRPVELVDPQTQQTYVLLSAEVYQRVRALVGSTEGTGPRPEGPATPEGQPMRVRVRELSMPPEVAEEVKKYCRKLGFWRRRYVQEVEDELKLQYYFGGQYVATLPSKEGPLIVAAGVLQSEAFDRQLASLPREERQRVLLEAVDPWNDPVSRILSPLSTDEG